MLDRGSFWTPAPEQDAGLAVQGLRVTVVPGLHQFLLSGDPTAISGLVGATVQPRVGFNDIAVGTTYAAAVARDRTLIISDQPLDVAEGWNPASRMAATVMDDAWAILDCEGADLDDLVSMATTIDRSERTPSSALLFASVSCLAYRYGSPSALRLHVERPLAPFLLEWIRRSMEGLATATH